MTEVTSSPARVVSFWKDAGPSRWFEKDEAFDTEFRTRFRDDHFAAAGRTLDGWATSAEGSLALLLLLDQFPRNCFRGTAHMFATDPLARHFCRRAIDAGHDLAFDGDLRTFFYLPLAHSEAVADQDESVMRFGALGGDAIAHAAGHRDIILRFGRFPHRNPLLGRQTTAEEQAFLDAGGFAG